MKRSNQCSSGNAMAEDSVGKGGGQGLMSQGRDEEKASQRLSTGSNPVSASLGSLLELGEWSHVGFFLCINQHWRQEGLDVKTMMNTWTLQKGFPLITITVRGRNVHMKQEHYRKGPDDSSETG